MPSDSNSNNDRPRRRVTKKNRHTTNASRLHVAPAIELPAAVIPPDAACRWAARAFEAGDSAAGYRIAGAVTQRARRRSAAVRVPVTFISRADLDAIERAARAANLTETATACRRAREDHADRLAIDSPADWFDLFSIGDLAQAAVRAQDGRQHDLARALLDEVSRRVFTHGEPSDRRYDLRENLH